MSRERYITSALGREIETINNAATKAVEEIQRARRAANQALIHVTDLESIRMSDRRVLNSTVAQLDETDERLEKQTRQAADNMNAALDQINAMWGQIGKVVSQLMNCAQGVVIDDLTEDACVEMIPGVEYVDVKWIAATCGCSDSFVRTMIREGRLPACHAYSRDNQKNLVQRWARTALMADEQFENFRKRKRPTVA